MSIARVAPAVAVLVVLGGVPAASAGVAADTAAPPGAKFASSA